MTLVKLKEATFENSGITPWRQKLSLPGGEDILGGWRIHRARWARHPAEARPSRAQAEEPEGQERPALRNAAERQANGDGVAK